METSTSLFAQAKHPWQLQMFSRSLKKRQKLEALLTLVGSVKGCQCLLITCGDNNGALNWYFRAGGGHWTWGDVAGENLNEIGNFLGEPVHYVPEDQFPFSDNQFDCVVSIDVLEHLNNDQPFLQELRRVMRSGGRAVVTVPNGDVKLWANKIKGWMGMTPAIYGHTRAGYTLVELSNSIQQAGLAPVHYGGYSRFFTEMIELIINFSYVFVLSRKKGSAKVGHIAPTSSGELKTHGAAFRLYLLVYPMMRLISKLDRLLPARTNNAVIVAAVKPEA